MCWQTWVRTRDIEINSFALYRLSYMPAHTSYYYLILEYPTLNRYFGTNAYRRYR